MTEDEELELLELEEQEYQYQKSRGAAGSQPTDPGILSQIGSGVTSALETLDSYTGAPVRSAVGALQKGENPFPAYAGQFGEDPKLAPSGKSLAKTAGVNDTKTMPVPVSDIAARTLMGPIGAIAADALGVNYRPDVSAADVAGLGLDVALDPVNLIPVGKLAQGGSKVLNAASHGVERAGRGLRGFAEKAALNATGATGKQAASFADDAGRQLLDRGIVQFGDSQAKIAQRAESAVELANKQIDDALSTLTTNGVEVDANDVYNAIRNKITQLQTDPSQADVARLLEGELDNLINATSARGTSQIGIADAEKIKRGYNRKAGNWADPEKGMAGKEMYQTYRGAVEDAAQAADPATAALFQEGKESYGLLRPIEEAAERRAATTSQSPVGGLLDLGSLGAGMAAGDPSGGVASAIARRVAGPRISSSVAVGADKVSKLLLKSPKMQTLATSNPRAFEKLVIQLSRKIEPGAAMPAAAGSELDEDSSTPANYREFPDGAKASPPGANNIGKLVKQYPQALGKFAKVLQEAEQRGPQGIASTHFILQQTNPEYRQMLMKVSDIDQDQ